MLIYNTSKMGIWNLLQVKLAYYSFFFLINLSTFNQKHFVNVRKTWFGIKKHDKIHFEVQK